MAKYERHQPQNTLLHEVVREQAESFLSNAREQGAPIARFVERELRAYCFPSEKVGHRGSESLETLYGV